MVVPGTRVILKPSGEDGGRISTDRAPHSELRPPDENPVAEITAGKLPARRLLCSEVVVAGP